MVNEKTSTDQFVRKNLDDLGLKYDEQTSSIKEVVKALKSASKTGRGGVGKPEFVLQVKDFLIIIEDKLDNNKNILIDEKGLIDLDSKAVINYATNGAFHYARHIANNSTFKKVFAIGITGNEKHHIIQPVYVTDLECHILDRIETFENFKEENIDKYFKVEVLGETPAEQLELQEIIKLSKELHEDLRNYGQLSEQEKPLVVSAILLALSDVNFSSDMLIGHKKVKDGNKLYTALSNYLDEVEVKNKEAILSQFNFIKSRVKLNEKDKFLGKTPLKYFTDFVESKILSAIQENIKEDILGRFYGEFVKYSGGDGKGLGIVLTPTHITELMCDFVDLKPNDIVLDPCAGTAGFLISGMHKMLKGVSSEKDRINIKKNQLHGIEIREDLYTIATTNMILRGDGKSNLKRMDFINTDLDELRKIKATVGLMNPPYSQAKTKSTAHLSELSFIIRLLDSLETQGRCAVIIPQSVMVGKTKKDRENKKQLLKNHTLEAVLTLNKDTFYGIGTNPCIAVFTAHEPHDPDKRVKFFNFKDDGYEVRKHIGLVATELAKDRKKKLLDVYFDKDEAPTSFMVKSTVEPEDEWLHSFYYFNDEIPSANDFKKAMADYLTFEFNMKSQGRGYLFKKEGE